MEKDATTVEATSWVINPGKADECTAR